MKKKLVLPVLVAAMSFGLVLGGASSVLAKASGPCSDCHTMHNSQDNAAMATDITGAADNTPNEKLLLKATCLACHTGTNDGTNNIPYVYKTSEPTYGDTGTAGAETLAGGSFYWVENGSSFQYGGADKDALGHNVFELPTNGSDGKLATPPGFDSTNAPTGLDTSWAANELTCAGTNGCHGDHDESAAFQAVAGGHHGDDSVISGATVASSYRFLLGIRGTEDSDWEYQPTASAHNQYYGASRSTDDAAANKATISYLCAQCHGDFHNNGADATDGMDDGTAGAPWIRHPTDFDLGNATGTEYTFYNGDADGAAAPYSVIAPVANTTVNSAVLSTVTTTQGGADGSAIVTCISCHRAHGTPYPDLLRWNYNSISAAGGPSSDGCFICHTTKDN